jgi:hypothetical protein
MKTQMQSRPASASSPKDIQKRALKRVTQSRLHRRITLAAEVYHTVQGYVFADPKNTFILDLLADLIDDLVAKEKELYIEWLRMNPGEGTPDERKRLGL